MKIIVLQGLPASLKTTWAREFVEKNKDFVRVSRDDLRNMRGIYWLVEQEDMISDWETDCIISVLNRGRNVVIDATNLNPKTIKKWEELVKEYNKTSMTSVTIEYKMFHAELDECIERDRLRSNSVGEKVIRDMYSRYIRPLKYKSRPKMKQDNSLSHAIICDLDGTLALINERNPYDATHCHLDEVNIPVQRIINMWLDSSISFNVIFVSGRDSKFREQTIEFLKKAGMPVIYLYMRNTGDNRDDRIIKQEIFDEHIRNKFFIEFVLDDRKKVVTMWRDIGLTCLQVEDGDF